MERQVILRNPLARRPVIAALRQLFHRAGFRSVQDAGPQGDQESFVMEHDGVELKVEWREGSGLEIRFVGRVDERCRDDVLDLITQRRSPEDPR